MDQNEVTAKTAWNVARAFRGSYTALMEYQFARDALALRTVPGIVCGAFSVELYLKCLLALEGKDVRKHEPSVLFGSLAADVRRHVVKHFGLPEPEVERLMERLDGAFEGWRYVHERSRTNHISHGDLDAAFNSLERAILAVHPDWPNGPA